MKSTPVGLFGQCLALVLAMAATGQAETISWYSSWSNSPSEIDIGSPVTNKIFLSSDTSPLYHTNRSFVAATNVTTYSTAAVTLAHAGFLLELTVRDGYVAPGMAPPPPTTPAEVIAFNAFQAQVATLPSYTFKFNGFFSGVYPGDVALSPTQNLLGITWQPDPLTQSAASGISESHKIGDNVYTVSFAGFAQSDVVNAQTTGGISFLIETSPKTISTVPEPGTLLLSGLGLSLCALPWWRRRRGDNHSKAPLLPPSYSPRAVS